MAKEVEKIVSKILNNKLTEFDAISKINSITNKENFNLFFYEFERFYLENSCEFMLKVNDETIKEAISFVTPLPKIKIYKPNIPYIKHFIKTIGKHKCFFNCHNMEYNGTSETVELVFLNDLMIDYDSFYFLSGHNKVYDDLRNETGNIRLLKKIYETLKDKKILDIDEKILPSFDLSDTTATENNSNFNPNHFNQKSYDLFLYLVENYEKNGKIKFINIFEFMRKSIAKNKYAFKFTQEKYTAFILLNYKIEIKKYAVADGYEYDEIPFLNSHEQQFDGR